MYKRQAVELMHFIGEKTKVTVLNVTEIEHSKDEVLHGLKPANLDSITTLFDESNVDYNVVIERGIPEETVIKYANSRDYDIITLGSRGLNSLQEIMMGSLSRKVVKKSEIPVLIVK